MRATETNIPTEVLAVLGTIEIAGNIAKMPQLERKLYVATNEALNRLGGTWNRKAGGHVFAEEPTLLLETAVETGRVPAKNPNAFWPTPAAIVALMIEHADIRPGMTVLEPSAGDGAIADAIRECIKWPILEVVEIDDNRRAALRSKGHRVVGMDFLQYDGHRDTAIDYPEVDVASIVRGIEEWRPVPIAHYAHLYEVSSWGRIRRGGRILNPPTRTDGYVNVMLSNGKAKSCLAHNLVAEAFIGPRPEGAQVNHRHPDGDKSRNWVSNLEYLSSGDNNAHQRKHRPAKYSVGEDHVKSKIRPCDVADIRGRIANGESLMKIGSDYGVFAGTIHAIASGKTWRTDGYERILLNPPFCVPGDRQAYLTHITHAWSFLKPGGVLVSVAPASVTFRDDKRTGAFRTEFVERYGEIVTLPDAAFAESGTGVSTVLVVLRKP